MENANGVHAKLFAQTAHFIFKFRTASASAPGRQRARGLCFDRCLQHAVTAEQMHVSRLLGSRCPRQAARHRRILLSKMLQRCFQCRDVLEVVKALAPAANLSRSLRAA